MTLFEWLLLGHLVGDFLLQTRWMAERKTTQWYPMVVHCTVYTAVVSLFARAAGGLPLAVAFIFVSHLFLDKRKFAEFWVKNLNGSENSNWLKIMIDQVWHLLALAVATLI